MTVHVTIGPLPVASAVAWLDNTDQLLDRLEGVIDKLPFQLPIETLDEFRRFARDARACVAAPAFEMTTKFEVQQMRRIMTYWFNVTQLDDAQRDRLGITFAPPAGRVFADALAAAMAAGMKEHPELADFAQSLAREWAACQPAFTKAAIAHPTQ